MPGTRFEDIHNLDGIRDSIVPSFGRNRFMSYRCLLILGISIDVEDLNLEGSAVGGGI